MIKNEKTSINVSSEQTFEKSSFDTDDMVAVMDNPQRRKTKIADILLKLGEHGSFQKRMLFYFIMMQFATSGIFNALPFIMHDPLFKCKVNGEFVKCNGEQACAEGMERKVEHDILSLVVHERAYCDGRWKKIQGQNILFILSSIIAFVVVLVMDKRGRRPLFFVVAGMCIFGSVILIFDPNYWIAILAMSILYSVGYIEFTNLYVYSTEVFNGKWRSFANSLVFAINYTGKWVYVMCNMALDNYYQNYVFIGICTLLFIPWVIGLQESPFIYYRQGDIEGLRQNLYMINKYNNKKDKLKLHDNIKEIDAFIVEVEKEKAVDNKKSQIEADLKKSNYFFDDQYTFKTYLKHIIVIILSEWPYHIGDSLVTAVPDKLGLDNIYISSTAFLSATVGTNILMVFYLHKIPRRKGNMVIVFIAFIFCLCLLIFTITGIQHNRFISWVELLITMGFIGLGMAQFLLVNRYTNEVFPTKLRAFSVSLVLLFGRSIMFVGNLIDPLSERVDIHPYVFVGVIYILALPLFMKYKETLHTSTKN